MKLARTDLIKKIDVGVTNKLGLISGKADKSNLIIGSDKTSLIIDCVNWTDNGADSISNSWINKADLMSKTD